MIAQWPTYTLSVLRAARTVARITAVVLLSWTALDLAYPQCCLDDRLSQGTSTLSFAAPGDESPTSQGDIEDCFCCARCLDTAARFSQLDVVRVPGDFTEPYSRVTTRSSTLDHPPQNA